MRFPTAPLAALGLSTLLLAACSSGPLPADRSFERGDIEEAAAAYEAFLSDTAPGDPGRSRALFRLALLHSAPDSRLHDPDRSVALYGQLVEENPGSPYAAFVGRHLYLARRIRQLTDEVEEGRHVRRSLEGALEAALAEAEALGGRAEASAAALEQREKELRELKAKLGRAVEEVQDREERLKRLSEALELLRQIDLEPRS